MTSNAINARILKGKNHFEILDGLRGIAAVAVVIFHFMEIAVPDYNDNFTAHSYLAVDFFFCLSGFVIAYAYDDRIQKMGVSTFIKLRLIRLHPLVIIGAVLGVLSFVFDPFNDLYEKYGLRQTLLMFLSSVFMVPYPLVKERYFNLFHFNPPTWSLFWEYIANVLYALILYRLRNKILWVLTILAAVFLYYTARHATNLSVGWGGDNFTGGSARVLFSFLAGMLVYRCGWIIRSKLGFISLGLLLLITFLFPFINKLNWLTDLLIVIIYFPLLVALGAGARIYPRFKSICKFSGDISYPLYMVHYPFIWIFFSYLEAKKPTMAQMEMIIPTGVILLVITAYVIMKYVDIPVRAYLKNKMNKQA